MKFLKKLKLQCQKRQWRKDYSEVMKRIKRSDENLGFYKLKNEKLGRVLTEQEIAAVKWFSTYHNGVWKGMSNYNNAIRNLIMFANIPSILNMYTTHAGDHAYEFSLLLHAEEMQQNNR